VRKSQERAPTKGAPVRGHRSASAPVTRGTTSWQVTSSGTYAKSAPAHAAYSGMSSYASVGAPAHKHRSSAPTCTQQRLECAPVLVISCMRVRSGARPGTQARGHDESA
jgi:hypothetical protein